MMRRADLREVGRRDGADILELAEQEAECVEDVHGRAGGDVQA